MNRLFFTCIAALLVAALQTAGAQQGTVQIEKQLARAHHKATVDGDLPGAIEEYKRIVAAAGANRALAAQALLRMAECYQKLGDAESRKVYERLVRDYSDQKESAAIARARLGDETQTTKLMALRKVWSGPNISSDECGMSSDGRYITCPAWETGDLGVHDVVTGTDRLLTTNNYAGNQYAHNSAISKDGRHVAYGWFNGKDRYELRLTGLHSSDTQPRTILDNEDIDYLAPSDWSPDGESVVVRIFRKDRTAQLGLVTVKDKSLRVLKTIDWNSTLGLFVSPDGRYIGFDMTADESNRNERDVFVLAVDGSRETPVVVHPGRDLMMGWSPDGRHLLFASDRSGTAGLWSVPISAGRPAGPAVLVKSDIAPASLGVSRSGALFVVALVGMQDISIAAIDLDGGKLGAPRSAVQSFVGRNVQPAWSRDGRHLAYVSLRGGSSRNRVIVIRSLETGDTRELNVAMGYFGPIQWAPDGRSFLVKGPDIKGRDGLYQIDAQTGQLERLPFEQPAACIDAPQLSPDAKRIYFSGGTACAGREGSVFLEVDLITGERREIFRGRGPRAPKLSPDGRFLAGPAQSDDSKTQAIVLVPVSGGPTIELLRLSDGRSIQFRSLSWTPDGRNVIATVHGKSGNEVLLIPTDGGEPRRIDGLPSAGSVGAVQLHPSGRQIAYSTGEYKAELWALENFLPVAASK